MGVRTYRPSRAVDLDYIAAGMPAHSTNSYIEAFNGMFQGVNLCARAFIGMATIKTAILLISGKLNSVRSILMPGNPLDF